MRLKVVMTKEPSMAELSRREFVGRGVIAAAATQLPVLLQAHAAQAQSTSQPAAGAVDIRWLEGVPTSCPGTTWGVPWPMGAFRNGQSFTLATDSGAHVPMQSWPMGYWPDGSLKWTAHAIGPRAPLHEKLVLAPGVPPEDTKKFPPLVRESETVIEIDTGAIVCRISKTGANLIESIDRDGRPVLRAGQLVGLRQDQPAESASGPPQRFASHIESATVEQNDWLRGVVKITGRHTAGDRNWLPFVVRLYFFRGGDSLRLMHTFIYDGDENRDFICGLGVRFSVPMRDSPHDRHVRFVGAGKGLWGEAVRNLTGLRRDAGNAVKSAQVAGTPTPAPEQFPAAVRSQLHYIPTWGDFTLSQLSADGFTLRKRTRAGHGWIPCGAGTRASGVGYVGGISGGVAFGVRDFWQKHPAQLDIRNAAGDDAEVTMWLWSPEAPAMDLRFYHDGMGMQTHQQELEGLNITYEDYEKGFGTPHGIARTSEMYLWACAATPSRQKLVDFAGNVRTPPQLACSPSQYLAAKVFGGLFSAPDRSTAAKARVEDQLDFLIDYYKKQVEQRRWYGFWDYGDVMHSYDPDRHTWRYDVGGYAWDNSELSPDLWLWYSYLRSGRSDIFRLAEAMTRHTGEVDVYHLGRFKMLGTRHNVQHWGCSAKQVRISTAAYRRFYYFLTADERTGDLMRELLDADQTFLALDPIRKIRRGSYTPQRHALAVGFGTDWGSLAAAWLTEWERDPQTKYREKLINGMKTIASMPHGFFTSGALYDLDSGRFTLANPGQPGASHLSAVFGLAEICAELIQSTGDADFEKTWLQYCRLFNGSEDEQQRELGRSLGRLNLGEAHSRLTAYAAARRQDQALAQRAWQQFLGGGAGYGLRGSLQTRTVEGPAVLNPIDEAPWVSTNASSQWGLAAIQNLALIGDQMP
jgi:hypothetical protein